VILAKLAAMALAAQAAFYRQAFFVIEPFELLTVHHNALTFEHQADAKSRKP